jgi:hypothetical protein
MKKLTFTEEQITYALRQAEAGTPPSRRSAGSSELANRRSLGGSGGLSVWG